MRCFLVFLSLSPSVLDQVWCINVLIPDLCLLPYIELPRGIIFQLIYVEIDRSDPDSHKHKKDSDFLVICQIT